MHYPSSITFFSSKEAAARVADFNGGEAEGFVAAPAVGRPGKYVVKVFDPDDLSFFLGYL